MSNGWGRQSYYVPAEKVRRARIASFTLQLLWSHGIVLVRLSIAASLWPLSRNKFWRGTLATLCIIQVILYCGWITVALGNCRPLHSFWDPIEAKCWPTKYTTNYAWGSACRFPFISPPPSRTNHFLIRSSILHRHGIYNGVNAHPPH